MKIRWFMAFLLLHGVFTAVSSQAKSKKCTSLEKIFVNVSCECHDLDDYLGWTFACYAGSYSVTTLFSLDYKEGNSITYECVTEAPNVQSLLQHLDLSDIHAFVFKFCPLPNDSFADILPYDGNHAIDQIKIESKRDNHTFSPNMFANISTNLKGLILSKNEIESLPESIFKDFFNLKYLSLPDNKLKTLPEKIFLGLTNLTMLEITNNALESLPENVFQSLFSLEKLYLYKNKLKSLPDDLFNGLVNLTVLDLSDNQIKLLSNKVFQSLHKLNYLRMLGNMLEALPENLFNSSSDLISINLSINRFREPLPEGLFSGLSKLDKIYLNNCNLTNIHENIFSSSPNITYLQLQGNGLSMLPTNLFRNNTKLKEINLSSNRIKFLPHLFSNHKNLEILRLYNNNLYEIPNGFFEFAKSIKILLLGSNHIRNMNRDVFRDLPQLEKVDLSNNSLLDFGLDFNKDINDINLSYNNLNIMPAFNFQHHLKLENINLQHNHINNFSIPVLYSAKKCNLNVAFNNIQTVYVREILTTEAIYNRELSLYPENYAETVIDLNSNPFLCDCNLFEFYEFLQKSEARKSSVLFAAAKNLMCGQPYNLVKKSLISLQPKDFRCDIEEDCPSQCSCFIRAEDNARITNCTKNQLKHLPDNVPHNTTVLIFQHNSLTNMIGFNNEIWENLTDLFLDNNWISNLNNWNIPPKLRRLSLSGNQITYFPSTLMNFISTAQEFSLTLSGNPWNCNCSAMQFKKWVADNYLNISDAKKIKCHNQIKENGTFVRKSILTIRDDDMCPVNDNSKIIVSICVVLFIIIVIGLVLYYRNRKIVIAYVYIHMHNVFLCLYGEEDIDEDKIFDAFVSYSSSDTDVAYKLIEELENKDPRLKLCIHERNWIAGNPISWNIFNSVQNSRKTILVISREFLESIWFQVEFHAAYFQMLEDKIDRLIIIVKGELPPKNKLDKELQHLLSTKTYLIWGEKWFWEKLKYALPHKKIIFQSNVMALKDRPDSEKIKSIENQITNLTADRKKTTEKIQDVQNGIHLPIAVIKENSAK